MKKNEKPAVKKNGKAEDLKRKNSAVKKNVKEPKKVPVID